MEIEGSNKPNVQSLYNECKKMMYYHAVLRMQDGTEVDGIIESVEPDQVNVLIGEDVMYREDGNQYNTQKQHNEQKRYNGQRKNNEQGQNNEQRQYIEQMQYGNPIRTRRFRRRSFPLAQLLALSLLRYPYYVPPYPYYPPYLYYPNYPSYPNYPN